MHADIDAREADREREQIERRRGTRDEEAEHRRAREARRRVTGRERRAVRQPDERLRMHVAERRAVDGRRGLERARQAVRREVCEGDGDEE